MKVLRGSPIDEPRPIAERLTEGPSTSAAALLVRMDDDPSTPPRRDQAGSIIVLERFNCVAHGRVTATGARVAVLLRRMGIG